MDEEVSFIFDKANVNLKFNEIKNYLTEKIDELINLIASSEYTIKDPTVSIKRYGSPYVGIIVNSSSFFAVSCTKIKGLSPENVIIILCPSSISITSLFDSDVLDGIYNGNNVSSIEDVL